MKGKNAFTPGEIERIKVLLDKKADARPMVQRRVREQLRRIGFYISDYDRTFASFTPTDLDDLISAGRISLVDKPVSLPGSETRSGKDLPPKKDARQSREALPRREPPPRPPILVTAAVIREGDKVLLAKRKKGAHQSGKWEFPGGRIERGESPEACLKRELKEELGVEARITDIFQVVYHQYSRGPVLLLAYQAEITGRPQPLEAQAVEWVDISLLDLYEFPPADLPLVEKLRASGTASSNGPASSADSENSSPWGIKKLFGLFGAKN